MPREALRTQILIVGAGPVGLLLAGELRLGGADVVIVERLASPTTESRASTLHSRTMEILDGLGLLDSLDTPPVEPKGHFGGIPLDLTLPTRYPGQWKVTQTRIEEILQEWALSLGTELRRGHELRALRPAEDYVAAVVRGPDGPLRIYADYLVACDGEESTVRRLSGADFPGQSANRELLRADVADISVPNRRFQRLEQGLAIASRRPDGVTRVMVHEFGQMARPRTVEPEFGEVAEAWKRVTGEDISAGTPVWVNVFGDANRLLTRYREGRVLYAGDAAHQQMPSGGQALNLGLHDAVNLGWKLAAAVRPDTPADLADELLESYHRERHAVGGRVLANIRAQGLLLLGGPEVEPVRDLLAETIAVEETRRRLAGMITGLDVRYPAAPGDHPLLGRRLPELPLAAGESARTSTALLRARRGLLLDGTGSADQGALLRESAAGWAGRVEVAATAAGCGALLVRPDGHVAWGAQDAADGSGLRGELHRWFGPPRPGDHGDG